MARGRSPGYEDQRAAILAQAAQLFAERGYPSTTMNEVAQACSVSKPTLYHYFRDKDDLLASIADAHVSRLHALVQQVLAERLPPEAALRTLIERFVHEYAQAQNAHRVLTQDVKFLPAEARERILGTERAMVAAFANTLAQLRPELDQAHMTKALTMLLFGMINWMFTWLKPDGALSHAAMAPMVADLFFGGVGAVEPPPPASSPTRAARRRAPASQKVLP